MQVATSGCMVSLPEGHGELTQAVIGCAIEVHRELGPGLLESVYQEALVMELQDRGLHVEHDLRIPVAYKGRPLRRVFYVDVVVNGSVLIEIKSVAILLPVHWAQVVTYLKLTGCPIGYLMNFNAPTLVKGNRRLLHPDLHSHR